MRSVLFPAAVLGLLTSCSPQSNRRTAETGMAEGGPSGDSATANASSVTPSAILSQLYVANTTEIQLSKLAAKQASSPAVKRLANELAADHSKNREEVRALAQKLGITLIPAVGGDISAADSAAMPPELQGKSGADFAKAFIEFEIREHQTNIEKIQDTLLPAGQDVEVKAYLQKTLTGMQRHLAKLNQVQQQLSS